MEGNVRALGSRLGIAMQITDHQVPAPPDHAHHLAENLGRIHPMMHRPGSTHCVKAPVRESQAFGIHLDIRHLFPSERAVRGQESALIDVYADDVGVAPKMLPQDGHKAPPACSDVEDSTAGQLA
jgi:hypothetical protein